jgi:integrase
MASFTPYKNGWRVHICVKGQRDSETFKSKREAQIWAERRSLELRALKEGTLGNIKTLRDAMRKFAAEVSPTHKGEQWECVRLASFEGPSHASLPIMLPLNEITKEHIKKWRDERSKTRAAATVNREMGLVGSVFSHAKNEWGWIEKSPLEDVRRPSKPAHRDRLISWSEQKAMLRQFGYTPGKRPSTIKELAAFAMLIALRTGMRAGEIVGTRWENVKPSWITLPDTKNNTKRDVPLPAKARRLVNQLQGLDDEKLLPIGSMTLDTYFRNAKSKAGLSGFTFHDTRHTAATRIGRTVGQPGKVTFPEFCKIFGWKDPKYALVYVNPTAASLAEKLS